MAKKDESKPSENRPVVPTVVAAAQVPLLYADGVGNVLLSPINTRVTFVVNVGAAKGNFQPTNPALEVVIPTASLLQFIGQFQEHVKNQSPGLLNALDQVKKQFAEHIEK